MHAVPKIFISSIHYSENFIEKFVTNVSENLWLEETDRTVLLHCNYSLLARQSAQLDMQHLPETFSAICMKFNF